MMDREFTPREKGMLLVLALLLLTLGYMKLFYAPVQQAVDGKSAAPDGAAGPGPDRAEPGPEDADHGEGAGGAEDRRCRARRPGPGL